MHLTITTKSCAWLETKNLGEAATKNIMGRSSDNETLCNYAQETYKNNYHTFSYPKTIILLGWPYYSGKGLISKTSNWQLKIWGDGKRWGNKKIIPLKLKTFEEAIKTAEEEEQQEQLVKRKSLGRRQHASHSLNNKLLIVSLFALAAIGSTYSMLDARPEVFHANWLTLSALWYISIAFSLFFCFNGARLGAFTAGVIGWITLIFWLIDNIYTVSGKSLIATSPNLMMILRNFIGAGIAASVVVASHNIYHKIRVNGIWAILFFPINLVRHYIVF
jgi:hypothetical protein